MLEVIMDVSDVVPPTLDDTDNEIVRMFRPVFQQLDDMQRRLDGMLVAYLESKGVDLGRDQIVLADE